MIRHVLAILSALADVLSRIYAQRARAKHQAAHDEIERDPLGAGARMFGVRGDPSVPEHAGPPGKASADQLESEPAGRGGTEQGGHDTAAAIHRQP